VSESESRLRALGRVVNNTLNISTGATKLSSMIRSVASTVKVGLSDILIFQPDVFQSVFHQNRNEAVPQRGRVKTVDSTVQSSDARTAVRGLTRVISKVVNIATATNTSKAIRRVIEEGISVQSFRQKLRALTKEITDIVQSADSSNYIFGRVKSVNESLYVRAKKTFQQAFQQDVFQSAREFVTSMTKLRLVDEVEQVADGRVYLRSIIKTITNTVQSAESITRLRSLIRMINNDLNVSDSFAKLMTLLVVHTEQVSVQSFRTNLREVIKSISESVQMSEVITKIRGLNRMIDSVINMTFTQEHASGFVKTAPTEVVNVITNAVGSRALLKQINDSINTAESYIKGFVKTVEETLQLSTGKIFLRSLRKLVAESAVFVNTNPARGIH